MKMFSWNSIAMLSFMVAALYLYATGEEVKGIFWAVMSVAIYVLDKTVYGEDTKVK